MVERADREWRSYLIGTVRDFVVWGLIPVGQVDRAKAEWLATVLSSGVARKTARTLAREIAREAYRSMRRSYCSGQGVENGKKATGWGGKERCRSTPVMRPSVRQGARFRSRRRRPKCTTTPS